MKANKSFRNITINHQSINQVKELEANKTTKKIHFIHYKREFQLIVQWTIQLANLQKNKKVWIPLKARK